MSEAPGFEALSPAGLPDGKMEDNAPVNVDAILQSILGTGSERFGMVAAVLRGERIIAQGVAGVRKEGPDSASRSMIAFTLVPAPKP
jgi:hypothetical protein